MPVKIDIKGPIIPSSQQWIYDWFGMEATSPKKVSDLIKEANGENLEIEINSNGGSVFAASEIYTALKSYKGRTVGRIVGLAASAASVIAMGVQNLEMSPTGQLMIHNSSSYSEGDYRDMEHTAEVLKSINETIANAYKGKTGKSQEELLALMDKETWMTADKAKELGFIDRIMFENDVLFVANTNFSGMLPNEVIEKVIGMKIEDKTVETLIENNDEIDILKAKLDLEIESSYFNV